MTLVQLFFFQAEDGIRDGHVTGVQTCALLISDVTGDEIINALQRWSEAVVLDVASVKTAIANHLAEAISDGRITSQDAQRYIGTHPMAGRERSGPVAARGELFTDRKSTRLNSSHVASSYAVF